jgi:Ribosome biogenesis regulatory protein (RRS1)
MAYKCSLPPFSHFQRNLLLAILPTPTYQLPRAKPLPKLKPLTKWEQFAAAKGIQKTVREKRVWDEEKQDWVNRWGRDGKNKEIEQAWITEVPANAGQFFIISILTKFDLLTFFFGDKKIRC